jgi:hypothetical protein
MLHLRTEFAKTTKEKDHAQHRSGAVDHRRGFADRPDVFRHDLIRRGISTPPNPKRAATPAGAAALSPICPTKA